MIYRNIKTGVEFDVVSELGGDWEPVKETKKPTRRQKKTKADIPEAEASDE